MPAAPVRLPATFVPTQIDLGHAAWVQHTPFLMDLLEVLRPRTFVELGVHTGNSYFAACEAVRRFDLPTRCFAIDTWVGDEHAGFYGEEVFDAVSRTNESFPFSTLVRSTFREALDGFEDGSIDLIHFDGRHFYEDIRDDFESWRPKLSDRSVALFHDIHVYERRFGVAPYWEEIADGAVTFAFNHGHGLGVMLLGDGHHAAFTEWFSDLNRAADVSRAAYFRLGEAVLEHHSLARERKRAAAHAKAAKERDELSRRVAELTEEHARSLEDVEHLLRQFRDAVTRREALEAEARDHADTAATLRTQLEAEASDHADTAATLRAELERTRAEAAKARESAELAKEALHAAVAARDTAERSLVRLTSRRSVRLALSVAARFRWVFRLARRRKR